MMKIYKKGMVLMLNLVHIRNDQAVTSSRTVAEIFEKRHDNVLHDIRKLRTEIQLSRSLRKIGISMKLNLENNAPEYLLLST